MHSETKRRSFVKTIVWRIIATIITWAVAYMYTGEVLESLQLTLTAALLSMIAYYIHERVWNSLSWGREKKE